MEKSLRTTNVLLGIVVFQLAVFLVGAAVVAQHEKWAAEKWSGEQRKDWEKHCELRLKSEDDSGLLSHNEFSVLQKCQNNPYSWFK